MVFFDNETRESIEKLISEHGDTDYDSLISEKGYYHFYHLSSLRHALMDWYPFEKGTALEIGPGYGGLTGLYLKKIGAVDVAETDSGMCESLKNRFGDKRIGIYQTDIFGLDAGKRYDYVFFVDESSLYSGNIENELSEIKKHLKENGTAVIGFRNKDGIKYSCGALDEYVTSPQQTNSLVDKKEFDDAARNRFKHVKYYYPFPDHIYTQAVFSDTCPPPENLRDRVMPLDPFDSPLVKKEIEEYGKAVNEGHIADCSNFCLAFLSDRAQGEPAVEQAILSYDRKERSVMTVFFSNGTVEKRAVNENGKELLKQSFHNLEELRERGVPVIDQRISGDTLVMPWIKADSLQRRIQRSVAAGDREGLVNVFQSVYETVIKSSETDKTGYDAERWGIPAECAGTILRKGYTDLIPLNAFDTNEGIMFYDQEFVEVFCPARYIMYRAILYSYMNVPEAEHVIPKREMYGFFGIDHHTEQALTAVENRFIEKVRSLELYRQMYGWAYCITDERIKKNRKGH